MKTRLWIGLFGLGGVLLLIFFRFPNSQVVADPDSSAYMELSYRILDLKLMGYKNGVRPLMYPLFLALVQKFNLNYFSTVMLFNYFGLGLLFFGFKKYFNLTTALAVLSIGLAVFFSRTNILFERSYLTESICLFVMSLVVYVFLDIFLDETKRRGKTIGKIIGLTVLIFFLVQYKPIFLYAILPGLFVAVLFLINKVLRSKTFWSFNSVTITLFVCGAILFFNKSLIPINNYILSRHNMFGNYATLGIQEHYLKKEYRQFFSNEDIKSLEQIGECNKFKTEQPNSAEALSPYTCVASVVGDWSALDGLTHLTVLMLEADPVYFLKVMIVKISDDFVRNIMDFKTIIDWRIYRDSFAYELFFYLSLVSLGYWIIFLNKKIEKRTLLFVISMEALFLSLFLISAINLNEDFGLDRVLLPSFVVYILVNSFVIFIVGNEVVDKLIIDMNNKNVGQKKNNRTPGVKPENY